MVGGFFPTPYPDECLYSILCRYCVRIGCTNAKGIHELLFGGRKGLTSLIFFPIRLNLVDLWYGANSGITRKFIAEKQTMHPYMSIAYPNKFRQQVDAVIGGANPPKTFNHSGALRSRLLWPKRLRYCPECVKDDIYNYGETYWHRVHQLPAMVYCTKHNARLRDSGVDVLGLYKGFSPASAELLSEHNIPGEDGFIYQHKEQFIKVGLESEWLLKYGADIDWEFNLHIRYKQFFRDKGIATIQGFSNYDLIVNAFEAYWGKDFLNCLRLELSDNREWIRQIYEARMRTFKPIYHILLMCFLNGSVETFLNSTPQYSLFGNPPWSCKNHLCKHYDSDVIENVDVKYSGSVVTGFFKCTHCGMAYKQLYQRKQLGSFSIADYGYLWTERMLQCLKDEHLNIPETAKVLRCSTGVVRHKMKKLGILGDPVYTRRTHYYDRDMGAEEYYKSQVLALCAKYDEVTPDILRQYAPKAFQYLYSADSDWLHEHMTLKANSKCQHDEDIEMLRRVQNAVATISNDGMPTRRLTRGFIAVAAGYKIPMFNYLADKRPQTKAYINTVVESKEDWLRRRVSALAQERRIIGEKISISDVKREMSFRPSTFENYEIFLEELIDELNE